MAEVIAMSPDSGAHCSLCKKTFVKESTLKRHRYYCRSKRPEASASRRRSCTACMRAKTRCTWTYHAGSQTCVRCKERSIQCEFDTKTWPDVSSGKDVVFPASSSLRGAPDRSIQHSGAFAFTPSAEVTSEDIFVGSYGLKTPNLPTAFEAVGGSGWDVPFTELPALSLDHKALAGRYVPGVSNSLMPLSDQLITGISALNTFQSVTPHPFNFRSLTKPSHGSLLTFATRILRSYPFMMLQNDTFPPFISAQMYQWSKTGQGPKQQSLLSCVSLIQIFKSRTEQNKSLIWRLIKTEQERIWAEHREFDQWELLAALQSLLLYCLLRLHDDPGYEEMFDAALLKTVNTVSDTLCETIVCDCSLPSDPEMAWRDWLFNESRRRTALVFRAINMLVDISAAMNCYPATGFGLIPLPCKANLWGSRDLDKWKTAFAQYCNECTMYALSESGGLMKLQGGNAGFHQSAVPWEEWSPMVGDVGTLVMMMGELLS